MDNGINVADLTTLAHQLDPAKATCRAIIETPKGSRNKFNYDPESNLFILGGRLRGKRFKITDTGGPKKAIRLLRRGIKAYQSAHQK